MATGRDRPDRYARAGRARGVGRYVLSRFVESFERHTAGSLVFPLVKGLLDGALEAIVTDPLWIYPPGKLSAATVNARAFVDARRLDPRA